VRRFRALRIPLVVVGAVFLCAQMSAELTVRACRRTNEGGGRGLRRPRTVLSLFIGRLEELVGDVLLLKADNCFHGQTSLLGRTRVGECHQAHSHHEHACGPGGGGSHDHDHEHCCDGHGEPAHDHHADGAGHEGGGALSYEHFLYRQYLKVAPTAHVHLGRHEEIVPWLYASVRLNAGNERAAVVAAYWLDGQLDRPREAERVLRAALAVRPSSWRLRAELGWLHYNEGRFGQALRQCESAIRLFEPSTDEAQADGASAALDLAGLWRLASACHEQLGDLGGAAACAEKVAEILPESAAARERLHELRARLGGEAGAEAGGPGSSSGRP